MTKMCRVGNSLPTQFTNVQRAEEPSDSPMDLYEKVILCIPQHHKDRVSAD